MFGNKFNFGEVLSSQVVQKRELGSVVVSSKKGVRDIPVMALGQFAGVDPLASDLSFPAATTVVMPAALAALMALHIALLYPPPPNDMEMISMLPWSMT